MFVELHIIQNFPPSNLNRDDLGQPKDADFGGYRRARISSQCLKRATRGSHPDPDIRARSVFARYTKVPLSSRTKLLKGELTKRLISVNRDEGVAAEIAGLFAEAYAGGTDSKRKDETNVLLYLSEGEFASIVTQLDQCWDDLIQYLKELEAWEQTKAAAKAEKKKEPAKPKSEVLDGIVNGLIKDTRQRTGAPDIALFGRMLADKPETNIDAACQVAHAISTHSIAGRTPIDYYTAVDELKPASDPGAGFLDVAYFNSACFYRYARIDVAQLTKNLGGDQEMAYRSIEAFLRASEAAIPSGKRNAHAQECRPSFMLAVVRESESAGWSLVNAFQKPVSAENEGDLIVASVKRLEKQFDHLRSFYAIKIDGSDKVEDTVKAFAVALPDGVVEAEHLGEPFRAQVKNMQGWVQAVDQALRNGG